MKSLTHYINVIDSRLKVLRCEHRDFRTSRHIIVFESDDWGSLRMSGRKDWEELRRMGYAVDKRPYERFDTLESPEDLEALFKVLRKHKDAKNHHPVITANMLMANPDIERIDQSGFNEYRYEPISDTYTRYFGDAHVLDLMRQGMDEGLFMPQSHGREHFNVALWMRGLRAGNEDLLTAFRHGMCGIAPKAHPERGNKLMNALLAESEEEQKEIDGIVAEGLRMFEEQWGFKSKTFVAPCYLWSEPTERVLAEGGVELIQTSRTGKPAYKSPSRHFYSGQRNGLGLTYSIRNCAFEPATCTCPEEEGERCLQQIADAFAKGKIAAVSSHRINYVGGIDESNRTRTLRMLDDVITLLLEKYPDVEFLSSDGLADIFAHR